MNFEISLNNINFEDHDNISGDFSFILDKKVIYHTNTDILEPLSQMFNCCIELLETDEATLFLNDYEEEITFKRVTDHIYIFNKRGKKIAAIDAESFLTTFLGFIKTTIKNLNNRDLNNFTTKALLKRVLVVEPFVSQLVKDLVNLSNERSTNKIYSDFEANTTHSISWKYLNNSLDQIAYFSSRHQSFLFTTEEKELCAVDSKNKHTKWIQPIPKEQIMNSFLETDNTFVLWNDAHEDDLDYVHMHAFDLEKGTQAWEKKFDEKINIIQSPKGLKNNLYIIFNNAIMMLDSVTGEEFWRTNTFLSVNACTFNSEGNFLVVIGNPIENEEIDEYQTWIKAIDITDGETLWTEEISRNSDAPYELKADHCLIVAEDTIQRWKYDKYSCEKELERTIEEKDYLGMQSNNSKLILTSINYEYDGQQTSIQLFDSKEFQALGTIVLPGEQEIPSLLIENMLVIPLEEGQLHIINTLDSTLQYTVHLDEEVDSSLISIENKVFFSSKDAHIKSIDLDNGETYIDIKLPRDITKDDSSKYIYISDSNTFYIISNNGNIFEVKQNS